MRQFFDLRNFLRAEFAAEGEEKMVFLGDYVDRGPHSVEVLSLLFLLKLAHPSRIYLLRGNHECRALSQNYGFLMECQFKFKNLTAWNTFVETFSFLPLAAVANGFAFLLHGGISPLFEMVEELDGFSRLNEGEEAEVVSDLLWSDPEDDINGFKVSPR